MVGPVGAIEYHERTKHSPRSVREAGHRLDFDNRPRSHKRYRGLARHELASTLRPSMVPALTSVADPGPTPSESAPVDLDVLTQLCYLSAGVTKRMRRGDRDLLFRAAACTGALYHIDLYVVTGPMADLPAGTYHFDPMTLGLDVLRTGDYRGVLAEATGGHPHVAEAPVAIVATSTWWRNAWKYRARTYRHAFWDSGTVLTNLLATAASLDVAATTVLGFADGSVARLLGLDAESEAPLEVVAVGGGADPAGPRRVDPIDPEEVPLSDHVIDYPLIARAYEGSTLVDGEAAAAWRSDSPGAPVGRVDPGDGERSPLDPVGDGRASKVPLFAAVRRRGSCRAYEREALNARKVATVLDRGIGGLESDVTGGGLRLNDVYCLVNGIEGVDAGVYRYHPESGVLERLRTGECRREAGHLALDQPLGADAALCVYFMTDLEAVVGALGDRGYRAAQLEAAVTAGRLYLGAAAHRDLGSTGLTFYDDAVTDFLSPAAAGQTPTFLWTLGRPA